MRYILLCRLWYLLVISWCLCVSMPAGYGRLARFLLSRLVEVRGGGSLESPADLRVLVFFSCNE